MDDSSPADRRCPSCGEGVEPSDRFCRSCGASLAEASAASAAADELRPVTALFADIVGSTGLGERLKPDEAKALIGECVSRMSAAVEEFGGMVQAYMGDGICAYFGVPRAREDDAERAARAGLRILEVIASYGREIAEAWGMQDFDFRVGINAGRTAVGLVGSADPETVALGDATNVAARLQAAAKPGSILVGETVAKLLEPRFVLDPVGGVSVKGREDPVEAFVLVGLRPSERDEPRTAFVGRKAELALLHAMLRDLSVGRGQILLLSGEPGIGKTRLLAELRALAADRVTWLSGGCVSYRGLPFLPFVEILRGWLGVGEADAQIALRAKARARLGEHVLPVLGGLLGIPSEERRSQSTASVWGELHSAYRDWLRVLVEQRPVVLVLEDVQWLDAASRALAESLLELADREALLIAISLRADAPSQGTQLRLHALGEYAHRTLDLKLGPLSNEESGRLIDALLPALDSGTRDALVAQAEGNPLYLEELVNALAEGSSVERGRTWTISVNASTLLPATLESLLLSRVDLLPDSARRLAQTAAAIGREFPLRVLERLHEDEALEEDLAALLRMQLVHELRRYPEREYTFKHGLLQDAVLSTLPGERRKQLYARVAALFEELYPDQPERLAHYYAQSHQLGKALEFLEAAAERATALEAYDEAREHLMRARLAAGSLGDAAAEARTAARLEALDELRTPAPAPGSPGRASS